MERPAIPSVRLAELAAFLGRPLEGDGEVEIAGVAPLESAGPRELAFVRSEAFAEALRRTRAGAVILPPGLDRGGRSAILSPHPGLDFARVAQRFAPPPPARPGIHPSAVVDPTARIDPGASVGALCHVGARASVGARSLLFAGVVLYDEVAVGEDCVLHARCVLREGTRVGDRVVLHPGVVLGADGFAYVGNERAELEKVPQLGCVVIEDDVEIGANSAVDRGSLGETRIGRGSKIDNLVQVGHNCRLAENVIVISQAGLAGSTRVERGAIVMAQAGVAGHLTIGAGAYVGPKTGVHKDVAPGERVYGSPQREQKAHHRVMGALTRLPQLLRRVRAIERHLGLSPAGEGPEGAAGEG